MVDSYLVSFAGLLLTMGMLGDRFGRKRALQSGIALFGLSSLAVLFVETSTQLIAVRALMGVGGALIMPATLSIITNVFPREERAKAIGIWAGTAAIGVGLGPLFGGLLLEYFDWSSVFLVNVPVALVAFLAGMRLVPDSRDPDPGRFDVPGALLSIAALVTLIYAVIEAPERGWLDPAILGAFGGALALGAVFVAWELRTASPMLDLSLFRNPRFGIGSLSISLAFFSLFGAIFALTQFLQFAKDYSPLEAGAAMVPLAFGLMLGATRSAKLAERFGTTRVVAAGLLGLGAMLATTLLWTSDMPYWPIGLWFFGVALSMGCVMGPATSSVMGAVPKEKAGVASAMNDVTRQVGGSLGTAIIGSLVASFYSSRVADAASGPAVGRPGRGQGLDRHRRRRGRPAAGRPGRLAGPQRGERVHRRAGPRALRRRGRRVRGRRGRHPAPAGPRGAGAAARCHACARRAGRERVMTASRPGSPSPSPHRAMATANPRTVTRPATSPALCAASGIIESISMTSSAPAAKPLMAALKSPEVTSAIA